MRYEPPQAGELLVAFNPTQNQLRIVVQTFQEETTRGHFRLCPLLTTGHMLYPLNTKHPCRNTPWRSLGADRHYNLPPGAFT